MTPEPEAGIVRGVSRARWLSLMLAVVAGCQRRGPAPEHDAAAPTGPLPVVRSLLDLEAADHKRAVVVGLYSIEPVRPQTKGARRVAIVLADGTHVRPAGKAIAGELAHWNKLVRVTGVVTKMPPSPANGLAVQTAGGPHVQIESIALAEGETPAPVPSGIPTPTLVSKDTQFDGRDGRWVAVSGKVDALLTTTAPFGTATLALADGTFVDVEGVLESEWAAQKGAVVTVVGRVFRGGPRIALHGAGPPCPGVVPRCALDDP